MLRFCRSQALSSLVSRGARPSTDEAHAGFPFQIIEHCYGRYLATALIAVSSFFFFAAVEPYVLLAEEADAYAGDPVHLGTIKVRPARRDREPDEWARERQTETEVAANLYERGLRALRRGERAAGQRILERVVARFPSSKQANKARRELAHLYADMDEASDDDAAPRLRDGYAPVGNTLRHAERAASPKSKAIGVNEVRGAELVRLRARVNERLGERLRLAIGDRVFFGPNSAKLGANARRVLSAQAKWLQEHGDVGVLIEGHADEPGNDQKNHELSVRRAGVVRDRLIAEGVPEGRLHITAVGRDGPVAQCDTNLCAAQNRRVVMLILRGERGGRRDGRGRHVEENVSRGGPDDLGQVMWLLGPREFEY